MFSTGIDPRLKASFMAVSLAIAVPSAVKVFNWITTLWNGKLRLTAPMLFCIGFVSNFIIGGVTGVFLAAVPVNLVLHDTYYVVGHFHYILMGVLGFAVFAAIYYWFPIVTGRMYQRTLAKWHFWLSMVGTNLTFFAMLLLGYIGMPRRYATYEFDPAIAPLAQVTTYHRLATVGALLLALGQLIWVWNVVDSWVEGRREDEADPWALKREAPRLFGREFQWAERNRAPTAADGGGAAQESESESAAPEHAVERPGQQGEDDD
jgi:cytochrome c oxidase subunit 1